MWHLCIVSKILINQWRRNHGCTGVTGQNLCAMRNFSNDIEQRTLRVTTQERNLGVDAGLLRGGGGEGILQDYAQYAYATLDQN